MCNFYRFRESIPITWQKESLQIINHGNFPLVVLLLVNLGKLLIVHLCFIVVPRARRIRSRQRASCLKKPTTFLDILRFHGAKCEFPTRTCTRVRRAKSVKRTLSRHRQRPSTRPRRPSPVRKMAKSVRLSHPKGCRSR